MTLTGPFDSYGKQRGWNNVTLYAPENEEQLINGSSLILIPDFALTMKQIIFSYFKNGKTYRNNRDERKQESIMKMLILLPPGEDPIILCPIYRNDGTSNEVEILNSIITISKQ